jgi:hypothetical protein
MLHLLDDAERMGRDTNTFPLFGRSGFDERLREYQTLSQENAAEVRDLFIERWNQQLVPLLSDLPSAQIQEAIPMIHAFIERTVHDAVSQVVEDDINDFLNGTFEINDGLHNFIAQGGDVYQGTPRTPQENPIAPIENSPHSPLPASENLVIAGLPRQPQGDTTPPAPVRVVRHLVQGSPLIQEVNQNEGQDRRRTAEEAELPDQGPASQRRRLDTRGDNHQQNLQFRRDHDDQNGPNGGGVPVN